MTDRGNHVILDSEQPAEAGKYLIKKAEPEGFAGRKKAGPIMDSHGRWPNFLQRKNRREAEEEFEDEIISMVEEGQEQGVLERQEADMIHNIFELSDKQVHDIMTRRNQIASLDCTMTLSDAIDYMIEENKTRFPVYREDLDDIIGMLHLRATVIADRNPDNRDRPIGEIPGLLYEAHFVPETKGITQLFREMQSKKYHIAVVVDEYGQTAGLLTMEDILEEIVGNILDECDEDETRITRGRDGSYLMEGAARLEDVEETLGIDFGDGEYETLNGFLINRLERIPSEKERPQIEYQGYRFQVLTVDNNVIQKVRVTPVPKAAAGSSKEK